MTDQVRGDKEEHKYSHPIPEVVDWRGIRASDGRRVLAEYLPLGDALAEALEKETARRQRAEILLQAMNSNYIREKEARELASSAERSPTTYDVVADAVNEIADAASDAFRAADITPGEWDGDNIVQDVKLGIVACIELLARRSSVGPAVTDADPFTLQLADDLFGCHVNPVGRDRFQCGLCERPIQIKSWVTAEHESDCFINQVRDYLAKHKPDRVPGWHPRPTGGAKHGQ